MVEIRNLTLELIVEKEIKYIDNIKYVDWAIEVWELG